MKLHVLLRTCNRAENNPTMRRILDVSRDELVLRCTTSLVISLNEVTDTHDVHVSVFDDSTEEFSTELKGVLDALTCPWDFWEKRQTNNESMKYCYEYAQSHFDEDSIIYFAEDDYLYFPNCFSEMLDAYERFGRNLGKWVAIHPADSPLEYFPKALESSYSLSRIVLGRDRHWRTSVSSPFTLLLPKEAFIKHYDRFLNYAKFDGVEYHEANTINMMFIDGVHLFTPIPSLAFHLGYLDPPAPFCDYKKLWESTKI